MVLEIIFWNYSSRNYNYNSWKNNPRYDKQFIPFRVGKYCHICIGNKRYQYKYYFMILLINDDYYHC